MKKIIILFVIFSLCLPSVFALEIGNRIAVNGKYIITEYTPYIIDNVPYYSVRALSDALNAKVEFYPENTIIAIKRDDIDITFFPKLSKAITCKYGEVYETNVYSEIINDRLYVPIEFFALEFNCIVNYIENEHLYNIIDLYSLWEIPKKDCPILYSRFQGEAKYQSKTAFDLNYTQSWFFEEGMNRTKSDRMKFLLSGVCEGKNVDMHLSQSTFESDSSFNSSFDLFIKEGLLFKNENNEIKTALPPNGVMQLINNNKSAKDFINAALAYYYTVYPPTIAEAAMLFDVFSNFETVYNVVAGEYVTGDGRFGTKVKVTALRLLEALNNGSFSSIAAGYFYQNIYYNPIEIQADILVSKNGDMEINITLNTNYNLPTDDSERHVIAVDSHNIILTVLGICE